MGANDRNLSCCKKLLVNSINLLTTTLFQFAHSIKQGQLLPQWGIGFQHQLGCCILSFVLTDVYVFALESIEPNMHPIQCKMMLILRRPKMFERGLIQPSSYYQFIIQRINRNLEMFETVNPIALEARKGGVLTLHFCI